MIIQIVSNLREEGYLEKGPHPTVAPFFAGANVAFRREAAAEVGGFDPSCTTGEDCDLCVRLSAADRRLYLRSAAVVLHDNPTTVGHLLRQWFGYGRYHPHVFAKHNPPAIELYARLREPINGERYGCLFYRLFPVAAVVFVTRFLVLNLLLLATVGMALAGCETGAWIGLALSSVAALAYAWRDLRRAGPARGLLFSGLRFLADGALFVGALLGGLRRRMLYLSATID